MEEFGEYGFFVTLDEEQKLYTNKYKGFSKDINIMTQINEDELLYNQVEMELEMKMGRDNNIYTLIIGYIKCAWTMFKFFIRDRSTM